MARNERGKLAQSLIDQATILNSIPENIWMVTARPFNGSHIMISCQVTREHAPGLRRWKMDLAEKLKTPFVLNPREISEKRAGCFAELGGSTALVADLSKAPDVVNRWFPGRRLPAPQKRITTVPRTDLTHLECFSVDDRYTRLAEQAISTERLPDGTLRAWVHIVDVAAAIPLDSEIGQFLLSHEISPMHPGLLNEHGELSRFREAICFHPQRKSDAISTAIDFRPDKSICYHKPVLSTVGNCQRVPHRTELNQSLRQIHGALSSCAQAESRGGDPPAISNEVGEIYRQLSSVFSRGVTELMIAGKIPAVYQVMQEPDPEIRLQFSSRVAQFLSADPVDFDASALIQARIREFKILEGISFNPGDLIPCRMFSAFPGEPEKTVASLTQPLRHFPDLVNLWQITAGIYGVTPIPEERLNLINQNLNTSEFGLGLASRPTGTIAALTMNARRTGYRLTGEVSCISNGRIVVTVKHLGAARLAIPAGYELALRSGPPRLQKPNTSDRINLQKPLRLEIAGFDLKRNEWLVNLDRAWYIAL